MSDNLSISVGSCNNIDTLYISIPIAPSSCYLITYLRILYLCGLIQTHAALNFKSNNVTSFTVNFLQVHASIGPVVIYQHQLTVKKMQNDNNYSRIKHDYINNVKTLANWKGILS